MSDEREFDAEEVVFRKDGTIIWKVEGQRTVLRRPKFKELRTLREEINDMAEKSREQREAIQERLRDLTDPINDRLAALVGVDSDPAVAAQVIQIETELREVQHSDEWVEIQAELRAHRNDADRELLAWFVDGVLTRFGKPVPSIDDPEDLPPWCVDQQFIRDVLEHWSSVPRRPGVV